MPAADVGRLETAARAVKRASSETQPRGKTRTDRHTRAAARLLQARPPGGGSPSLVLFAPFFDGEKDSAPVIKAKVDASLHPGGEKQPEPRRFREVIEQFDGASSGTPLAKFADGKDGGMVDSVGIRGGRRENGRTARIPPAGPGDLERFLHRFAPGDGWRGLVLRPENGAEERKSLTVSVGIFVMICFMSCAPDVKAGFEREREGHGERSRNSLSLARAI
jgi:hypothetical protein